MAQQRETREVLNPSLLAVGQDPDVLIMRLQSGLFLSLDGKRRIRVGQPGMPDTLAVVAVTVTPDMVGQRIPVAVAPEMKTATGPQRKHQHDWQTAFEKRAGIYRLIRSAGELVELIEQVKAWRVKN